MRGFYRLLAGAAALMLTASVAKADPFYYAEILTSEASPIYPDVKGVVTLSGDFDPMTFDWTGMTSSPGLGSALVTETASKSYTHTFDPTPDSASLLRAWLFLSVTDDQLVDPPETASVELDGSFWQTGQATFNLLLGEITALGLITVDGDTLDVTVSSVSGGGIRDFNLLASALKVEFVPVPEPGTAALMGAGLGVTLLAGRRASRGRR